MARFDALPADQQSVLRLLLTQDGSYEEIARSLRMAPAAVRDRAYDALGSLGADGQAPAHEARAEIADYLLGRRADVPAALDDPSVAAWAQDVREQLAGVAGRPLPEVHADATGDAGAPAPGAAPAAAAITARSTDAPRGSRVGGAILLTGAAILGALVIGFFVGRASKTDSPKSQSTAAKTTSTAKVFGQANLNPVRNASAPGAVGVAQFARQSGKDKINVIARNLPKIDKTSGYGVWLISRTLAPVFLGYFTAITTAGEAASQSELTVDARKYGGVVITHQTGRNPTTPGKGVIGGQIKFTTS